MNTKAFFPCGGGSNLGIVIFEGVLTKLNFSMKFPHLPQIYQFNERPKI